ncbi:hypothetical protein Droror1_Dr00001067 [Drosera rotundifolia]
MSVSLFVGYFMEYYIVYIRVNRKATSPIPVVKRELTSHTNYPFPSLSLARTPTLCSATTPHRSLHLQPSLDDLHHSAPWLTFVPASEDKANQVVYSQFMKTVGWGEKMY